MLDDKEIVTDVGAPAPKIFAGARTGRPSLDVDDFDVLRAAAHRLADASAREVMGVSLNEARALYRLAAVGADIIYLASAAVAASDAGAPRADIIALQAQLADHVRPLIGRE